MLNLPLLSPLGELPKDTDPAVPHVARASVGLYDLAESPAGGLWSTAEDLARFLGAFTAGGPNPLLSEAWVLEMLPPDFTRGLAWWGRDAWYGVKSGGVWTHGGFMEGVRTHLYLYPASATGMVIGIPAVYQPTDKHQHRHVQTYAEGPWDSIGYCGRTTCHGTTYAQHRH